MQSGQQQPVAELAFMPWVRLGEPHHVGPVVFFDYPDDDVTVELRPADRARVDRIKRTYRTWPHEDEVTSVAVATIDAEQPLRPLEDNERGLIQRAGYVLAFACLAHGYHHPYLTVSSTTSCFITSSSMRPVVSQSGPAVS